jgi:hypothetical protein
MGIQIHVASRAKQYFPNDLRPSFFSIRLAVGAEATVVARVWS